MPISWGMDLWWLPFLPIFVGPHFHTVLQACKQRPRMVFNLQVKSQRNQLERVLLCAFVLPLPGIGIYHYSSVVGG